MVSSDFTHPASGVDGSNLGLIFTDSRGRVVFLDNRVLALLGQANAGRLVGESLHSIIGVTFDEVSGLLTDIARTGYVQDRALVITREDGIEVKAVCNGIANYDDQHMFIGADLTLHEPHAPKIPRPATHNDVLNVRIQQIEAEAPPQVDQAAQLAQLYFTALIGAMHVLLARTGGQRVSQAMENAVNRRAAQSSWPVRLADGNFVTDSTEIPPDIYVTLINEAIGYARNVIGSRVLFQEMRDLDQQMKPAARDVASQFGMRDWAG